MTLAARIFISIGLLSSVFGAQIAYAQTPFRFHLPSEPSSLAPAQLGSADVSLLFNNLYRGLYTYSNEKGLEPEGAESCTWAKTNLELTCKLSTKSLWSDGKVIEAADYVRGWKELFSTNAKAASSELLLNVKNARAILRGEKKKYDLGVVATDPRTLKIIFDKSDPEFLYKLALVTLVPIRNEKFPDRKNASTLVTNGPYKISSWRIGNRLYLEPNNNFHPASAASRPPVEVVFVEEDLTALNLYEAGELTFMRRLPTQFIKKFTTRPDFVQFDVSRFDYVGFGDELASRPHLRKALSLSLNYIELQKIHSSPGIPGCAALSEKLFTQVPCVKFDLAEAKKELEISKKTEKIPTRLQLVFSKLGGDSIRQSMEWFHGQWTKNLGLTIDLMPTEQGVFLDMLRTKSPTIFRKGVGLDRATCLAAAETFAVGGPENFLKFNDAKYESLRAQLATETSVKRKKEHCTKTIGYLLDQHRIIPVGRYSYSALASPKFTGWTINELHQLDLTRLKRSP